ncbi:hypothetical protein Btru_043975 [Bulinus truncatus]|nr:hypothetical protein Btru_043975 [Bulinus truncatus]
MSSVPSFIRIKEMSDEFSAISVASDESVETSSFLKMSIFPSKPFFSLFNELDGVSRKQSIGEKAERMRWEKTLNALSGLSSANQRSALSTLISRAHCGSVRSFFLKTEL